MLGFLSEPLVSSGFGVVSLTDLSEHLTFDVQICIWKLYSDVKLNPFSK